MRRECRLLLLMRYTCAALIGALLVLELARPARGAKGTPTTGPATQPSIAGWIHTNADPKVDRIEQEVQRRRQANPAAAEALEKDLERVRDLLAGRAPALAANAKAEL